MKLNRNALVVVSALAVAMIALPDAAQASTSSGSSGAFAGAVTFVNNLKGSIDSTLPAITFMLWVATAGAAVAQGFGGGWFWTMGGAAFGATGLLFSDQIIASFGGGAVIAPVHGGTSYTWLLLETALACAAIAIIHLRKPAAKSFAVSPQA